MKKSNQFEGEKEYRSETKVPSELQFPVTIEKTEEMQSWVCGFCNSKLGDMRNNGCCNFMRCLKCGHDWGEHHFDQLRKIYALRRR